MMTIEELNKMLEEHLHWIRQDCEGWDKMRLDLSDTDLKGVNLRGTCLKSAILNDADLRESDLESAILINAYLNGIDLSGANLRNTDLFCADLRGVNLRGADLSGADLWGAKGITLGIACPTEGEFVAWKKARLRNRWHSGCIVKLKIPDDAKRLSATTRKCRTNKAIVIGIETLDGKPYPKDSIAHSVYDPSFLYKVGDILVVEDFDENRWNECSTGIHFFIDRNDAVAY